VTTQARAFRALFRSWGWEGEDLAAGVDPRVRGEFHELDRFEPPADATLLVHYSAYAPGLRTLVEGPNRTLLLSHNITPAEWLWDHEPHAAVKCAVGRLQLAGLARTADACAAVSDFNARELRAAGARHVGTIPVLFEPPPAAERASAAPAGGASAPEILFVGRLSPHKRHDDLIRAFAVYRDRHAPGARLRFVGSEGEPAYTAALRGLGERLAPGAVTIESGLAQADLWDRYRRAAAFLCLSEHEGFCIPLLEAFAFGVPVIARPSGGVPEVAGDAALLVADRDPAVIAELLSLAVGDAELRGELARRGEGRLVAFAPEVTAAKLRTALEALA
jgi:glycosyltransferase involved in cell wall biosynthesis